MTSPTLCAMCYPMSPVPATLGIRRLHWREPTSDANSFSWLSRCSFELAFSLAAAAAGAPSTLPLPSRLLLGRSIFYTICVGGRRLRLAPPLRGALLAPVIPARFGAHPDRRP